MMTAFYSWRLLLMTFHGETRADHETYHHVHESPWVMLVPLIVLAVGAVFAGWLYYDVLRRRAHGSVLGRVDLLRPEQRGAAPRPRGAAVGEAGAAGRRHRRHRARLPRSTCSSTDLPGKLAGAIGRAVPLPAQQVVFRRAVRGDSSSSRRRRSASACGRAATASIIDGLGPDGIAAVSQDVAKQATRLQSGYVYHYAFAMLIGVVILVTWYMFGSGCGEIVVTNIPHLLTIITFLPLVGAAFIAGIRGEERACRAQRPLGGAVDLRRRLPAVAAAVVRLRPLQSRLPVRGARGVDPGAQHRLPHGRRRHLHAVRAALHPADADLHPGELGSDRRSGSRNT